MASKRNFYEVLGVSKSASADEIREAYRALARKYHPDVNSAADAAARFAEVQEAYETLFDPERRATYDRGGRRAPSGAGGQPGAAPDFADIFDDFFGQESPFGGGGGRARSRTQQPPVSMQGPDVSHEIQTTFMSAAVGGTERFRWGRDGQTETIEVRIPPGLSDGDRLRVKGRGDPGIGGAPNGDLIVTVRVGRHPYFRRDKYDLLIDVPITIAEAGLGATVDVPLLSEGEVAIKIPAGTSSGAKLRVKGQGIERRQGERGDLIVIVQIVGPSPVTEEVTDLLGKLVPHLKNPRSGGLWAD